MKKALIITSKLVQDHEFIYPFYRLKEEGYEVLTCNCENKIVSGYFGTKIPPKDEDKLVNLEDINSTDYKLLILPGGVKSMEILRVFLKNKKKLPQLRQFQFPRHFANNNSLPIVKLIYLSACVRYGKCGNSPATTIW